MVRLRADVKRKINALLLRHGYQHEYSDLFGKAGMQQLYSLDLPMCDRFELDNYLKTIDFLTEKIKKIKYIYPENKTKPIEGYDTGIDLLD